MSNLKELRVRIASVKSTQKITKAMKMVAASKLKRAQERAENARPYSEKIEALLKSLSGEMSLEDAPPLLVGHRDATGVKDNTHLIIVATSDKGLCGGFNSSIVKVSKKMIADLQKDGKNVKIITVGKKGLDQLKYLYGEQIVHKQVACKSKNPEYTDAEIIAAKAIKMFENEEVDSCTIIYNKFISPIEQKVATQKLIPQQDLSQKDIASDGEVINSYEYEPTEDSVLSELLPRNIAVQIFHAILENAASEQGSRMTAMDNATRNAGDMIDGLSLIYNRSRQAAITTELTEIISGAEAL